MEDHLSLALEIVKAQAKVRTMTETEIGSLVDSLSATIRGLDQAAPLAADSPAGPAGVAKKAIRERTITCLESGKSYKPESVRSISSSCSTFALSY